jgi:hypothetical protein
MPSVRPYPTHHGRSNAACVEASAEGAPGGVEWIRHLIDYGGRVGGGMQIPIVDIDADGDLDLVAGGKRGLFLIQNDTKSTKASGISDARAPLAR